MHLVKRLIRVAVARLLHYTFETRPMLGKLYSALKEKDAEKSPFI